MFFSMNRCGTMFTWRKCSACFVRKGEECLLAEQRQSMKTMWIWAFIKRTSKSDIWAATQLGMPNLCVLRAYLMPGVYLKHRWCESCRWPHWKGRKKPSSTGWRRGRMRWVLSGTETDPTCNLQPWQPHNHLLFLQHTAISPQILSTEHGKLKRARQDFLVFPLLCFSFYANPYFLIFPPLFSFSSRRLSSIEGKKVHHLTAGRDSGETLCSCSYAQCNKKLCLSPR